MRRFAIKRDGKVVAEGCQFEHGSVTNWVGVAPGDAEPVGDVVWLEGDDYAAGAAGTPVKAGTTPSAEYDRGKADAAKVASTPIKDDGGKVTLK